MLNLQNVVPMPYKPFLSATAFNPRHPMFQKFMFEEPPAPKPEDVAKLQADLAAAKAELEKVKASGGAAEDYKKDMLKYKDLADATAKKLAEIEAQRKADQDKVLAGQGEFKTLYDREKEARIAAESQIEKFKTGLTVRDKIDAVLKEARAAGLKAEAEDVFRLLPMEGVVAEFKINEQTQAVSSSILGAKEYVEAVKKQRPFLFGTATTPGVRTPPPSATLPAAGEPFKISPTDLSKMEREEPEKYKDIMGKVLRNELQIVRI